MYRSTAVTDAPPPFVNIMRQLGFEPDPWQADVLLSTERRLLLNCCRQAGKSTVVAVLALVQALFNNFTKVLIVSRSHRQSKELLRLVTLFHRVLKDRLLERRSVEEVSFTHFSRIISVPCKEETIRGYAGVDLLIVDEAARVPDEIFRAVLPMLAVSKGRIICLSTPDGKRGFFYNAWAKGGDDWKRVEIPATKIPRIDAGDLERERRILGEAAFRQEYCCSFESVEGLVYPDFARCVVGELPSYVLDIRAGNEESRPFPQLPDRVYRWEKPPEPPGTVRRVGGIDFGFRNPFAAVWGAVDRDDVLWLTGEHYARLKPLSYHVQHLPKDVMYQADPSSPGEIDDLIRANFRVRRADNAVRPGIAAVSARLEEGTLRILEGRCPNLLHEAGLCRYGSGSDDDCGDEIPIAEHNHALDALRYLIMDLDSRKLARRAEHRPLAEAVPREKTLKDVLEDNRVWRGY